MKNKLKRPEIIRKHTDELEMVGSGKYYGEEYKYQGKPYTGFVIFDYWPNGNIMGEAEHVDGVVMGWEVDYYENGNIEYAVLMYGGKSVVYYEYSESGELIEEGWVADKKHYNDVAKLTGIDPIELTEEEKNQ